jgi:hypothetical protein
MHSWCILRCSTTVFALTSPLRYLGGTLAMFYRPTCMLRCWCTTAAAENKIAHAQSPTSVQASAQSPSVFVSNIRRDCSMIASSCHPGIPRTALRISWLKIVMSESLPTTQSTWVTSTIHYVTFITNTHFSLIMRYW